MPCEDAARCAVSPKCPECGVPPPYPAPCDQAEPYTHGNGTSAGECHGLYSRAGHTPTPLQQEHGMHRRQRLTLGIVGLVFLLGVGRSWGGPPNPTMSDVQGNTAGGTNALVNTTGHNNTAFGDAALGS